MLIFQLKLTSFVSDVLNPYVFPAIIQPATSYCSKSSQLTSIIQVSVSVSQACIRGLIKTTGRQKMWTNGQLMTGHHSLSHFVIDPISLRQTLYRISLIMYITMESKNKD